MRIGETVNFHQRLLSGAKMVGGRLQSLGALPLILRREPPSVDLRTELISRLVGRLDPLMRGLHWRLGLELLAGARRPNEQNRRTAAPRQWSNVRLVNMEFISRLMEDDEDKAGVLTMKLDGEIYEFHPSNRLTAADAVNDYTRLKMREDGFWHKILPSIRLAEEKKGKE